MRPGAYMEQSGPVGNGLLPIDIPLWYNLVIAGLVGSFSLTSRDTVVNTDIMGGRCSVVVCVCVCVFGKAGVGGG